MDLSIANKFNKRILSMVERPNFKPIVRFDFDTLYNMDETFYQIFFYDRTNEYSSTRIELCVTNEVSKNIIINALNDYNEKLEKIQEELSVELGKDKDIYLRLYRVGEDVGYCYIDWYDRNRILEEAEAEECMPSYDEGYLGGAFDSYEDFLRWKEK